ncbi:MAG TPA: Uma2 family endonuclease [Acetobacteraceae bacterium]|nr:Uma2 family endonuclease [Acetobacteraceae bacterium]
MSERAVRRMTETEFLEWQHHQEMRYELVDGVPRAMTGARFRHDRVLGNAFGMLLDALEAVDSLCRPFTADIAVRVPTGDLRRPDVAVYCPPFDEDAMVSDRPRLVVEVLSESTEDTDQHVKVDEYQHMDAVDYIVLVAPRIADVLVWSREEDHSWRSIRYQSLDDVVPLPRFGVSLSLSRLYRSVELRPRPRLVSEDRRRGGPLDRDSGSSAMGSNE